MSAGKRAFETNGVEGLLELVMEAFPKKQKDSFIQTLIAEYNNHIDVLTPKEKEKIDKYEVTSFSQRYDEDCNLIYSEKYKVSDKYIDLIE